MKYTGIPYEALDTEGRPAMREARVIGELPTPEMRLAACAEATEGIGKLLGLIPAHRIPFGAPAYHAFGMTGPEATGHLGANLLFTLGCDVPLSCCDKER